MVEVDEGFSCSIEANVGLNEFEVETPIGGFKAVDELEYFMLYDDGKMLLLGMPLSLSYLFSQVII